MSNANPYRDASPFGRVKIAGVSVPGVIQTIEGFRKPDEWTFQKGSGGNNAATVWKGTKLAESGKLTIALFDLASFDAYEALRIVARPKLGTKPPSLPIESAIINGNGVLVVVCVDAPVALWIKPGGYWLAEMMFAEFNPPAPAKTGAAGAAKTPGTPPETAGEKQLREGLQTAAELNAQP